MNFFSDISGIAIKTNITTSKGIGAFVLPAVFVVELVVLLGKDKGIV
ncbi:protein of unknown function [Methanocaldococcus lauensis]|nr:protein of unknown function [Methanocaldococcus lauensis]